MPRGRFSCRVAFGDERPAFVARLGHNRTMLHSGVRMSSSEPAASADASHNPWHARRYVLRSRFFRFFGGAYELRDEQGRLCLYAEMKRFRLKEDIRVYADVDMREEVLRIRTESILDFSGAYDVEDSRQHARIGTLRRSGLRSAFVRDHWQMLDPAGQPMAELQEDSLGKSLLRRLIEFAGEIPLVGLLGYFFPQSYALTRHQRAVAHYHQRFNPFIYKLDIDLTPDTVAGVDRRLAIAMAVLLAAIEGRQ
ncbi:hypothetical protein C41B8_15125 [Salinisphaera hydrothermalis C41B8]|uniref:Uncharacterized protein n=2 Tax=Salinisphaera TaxID=180541 RepID=A0A084IIA0_SALHC|nr:hypothetical protein C41B8_15125 [Salinisphaera hydrothermalis C41B8]